MEHSHKKKNKKILQEQATRECGALPDGYNEQEVAQDDIRTIRGCLPVCKKGNKFYRRCRLSSSQLEGLQKYEGDYKTDGYGILPSFKLYVKATYSGLQFTLGGMKYDLVQVGSIEDEFTNETYGIDASFDMQEEPNEVRIRLSIPTDPTTLASAKGLNISRLIASPNVGDDFTAKRYERQEDVRDGAEWDCLKTAVERMEGIRLVTGVRGKYKYLPVEGGTDYYFYVNPNKVEWKDNELNLLRAGTWECTEDGRGIIITWDNGTKDYYPREIEQPGQRRGQDNEQQQTQRDGCRSYVDESKPEDVEAGRAVFKKCMKGPTIEKIQNIPSLKNHLFEVLRSNNLEEKTDEFFGSMMEKAVKIFQSTNGLYTLNQPGSGIIDKKTYRFLKEQDANRPRPQDSQPPNQTISQPQQQSTQTASQPKFANAQTKF